mgnify:CR=1 FL=1
MLDRVTTRILEIEGGGGYVHDGGYASYLANRAERAERDASTEAVRRNLAKSELAWLRRGAPARTRKPKARITAATAIVEGGPAPARAAARVLTSDAHSGMTYDLTGPSAFIPVAGYLAIAIILAVWPPTSRWGAGLLIGLGIFTLLGGGVCVGALAQMGA